MNRVRVTPVCSHAAVIFGAAFFFGLASIVAVIDGAARGSGICGQSAGPEIDGSHAGGWPCWEATPCERKCGTVKRRRDTSGNEVVTTTASATNVTAKVAVRDI